MSIKTRLYFEVSRTEYLTFFNDDCFVNPTRSPCIGGGGSLCLPSTPTLTKLLPFCFLLISPLYPVDGFNLLATIVPASYIQIHLSWYGSVRYTSPYQQLLLPLALNTLRLTDIQLLDNHSRSPANHILQEMVVITWITRAGNLAISSMTHITLIFSNFLRSKVTLKFNEHFYSRVAI